MNIKRLSKLTLACVAAGCVVSAIAAKPSTTYRFTTDIPDSITIDDKVKTSIGTLRFDDGYPTPDTVETIYDELDFQRGVQSFLMAQSGAAIEALRRSIEAFGPANTTHLMWEEPLRLTSQVMFLTPNTTVLYHMHWLDLNDGPVVIETPANVLGLVDDHWFQYVTDFGNAGEDRGAGGKYLFVPPNYEGELPTDDEFIIRHSKTYGNWVIERGFLSLNGRPDAAQCDLYGCSISDDEAFLGPDNIKDNYKVYPYGEEPGEMNFINVSGVAFNTVHATDFGFWDEINTVVQENPNQAFNPEVLGLLARIGIKKGQDFNPDTRMTNILTDAANVGHAASRVVTYENRQDFSLYPDSTTWETGFPGGSEQFLADGVRLHDQKVRFHFYATGITPAMVVPIIGGGSQYSMGLRDSDGSPFDGAKTYRIVVPKDVPARRFWALTVYASQTRSMVQTDQVQPEISSNNRDIVENEDGSTDVWFGPELPEGVNNGNWIQTVPGQGWTTLWRIYGPEQEWFDKSWELNDIELMN